MAQPITIVNNTNGVMSAQEFSDLVAALNGQAKQYNESPWVTASYTEPIMGVSVLEPGVKPIGYHIELLLVSTERGALGWHEDEPKQSTPYSLRGKAAGTETPLAKVFVLGAAEAGVAASEVVSHELLEMMVDPYVTNEADIRKYLDIANGKYYIAEVGDPVQGEGYTIGTVTVANFCFPGWWNQVPHTPLDFRGTRKTPFELAPGGYISVQSSPTGEWEQVYAEGTPVVEPAPEEPAPEPEPTPAPQEPCPCEEQIAELRKRVEALEAK